MRASDKISSGPLLRSPDFRGFPTCLPESPTYTRQITMWKHLLLEPVRLESGALSTKLDLNWEIIQDWFS